MNIRVGLRERLRSGYSSVWVGIDGYADNTVERVGTEEDSSGSYYVWYEMYPRSSHYIARVYPGDAISAELAHQGGNHYRLTITDSSPGHIFSYSTRQTINAQRMSAEWVVEAPSSFGGVLPLADFGSATFTSARATLTGRTGSISDLAWKNDPMTMVETSEFSLNVVGGHVGDLIQLALLPGNGGLLLRDRTAVQTTHGLILHSGELTL